MQNRCFLFDEGKTVELEKEVEDSGERIYFHKTPKNFLELNDELKKLSFLCNGVYVLFTASNMEIFFFKRESIELFTKLHLSSEPCSLDINERLRDFLYSIED